MQQKRALFVTNVAHGLSGFTVRETGRDITPPDVIGWLQSGKLKGFVDDEHQWRVLEEDLQSFMTSRVIKKKRFKTSGSGRKLRR